MEFSEVLERFRQEDPQDLLDALEELNQASINAASEAQKARAAYFADAQAKERKIADRVQELKTQRDGHQAKIDAFKNPLISATAAGDLKKLANIKEAMKTLELDKTQVSTEIAMLESAHIRGDEALYNAVLDRVAEHSRLLKIYQLAKSEVHSLAGEKEEAYRKIARDTLHINHGGGNGINLEELNRHFHYEVYAKHEEQAAKERAENDAKANRNTFVYDGVRRPFIAGGGPV